MPEFTFLHAADLHLDSPLLGLTARSPEIAARVGEASRRAFDRLVDLAIERGCRFVVLAGDVFDGDLRNVRSGLAFLAGMSRLGDAGIPAYLVAGNHDAENRFFDKLRHAANVRRFDHRRAHTHVDEDLGVAIHGRSFDKREVTENIAAGYPPPRPNLFNVGVLHTACLGNEGKHAAYAPCTLEQLVHHGYDYWALGHVHARRVLAEHPHVVYPGNVQGRSVRETGAKGATLVHVSDGRVETLEHHDLDEVRWAVREVDLTDAADIDEARARTRDILRAAMEEAGDRALAIRLVLGGETSLHGDLVRDRAGFRADVEAMVATLSGDAWIERIEVGTRPVDLRAVPDPTVAGRLSTEVTRLGAGRDLANEVERRLAEVRGRMPLAAARFDELAERVRARSGAGAMELALAVLRNGGGGDAVR